MYVPNYIPEPLEVPENVTRFPYSERLVFIRRVVLLHSASLLGAAGISQLPLVSVGIGSILLALAALLIALDILRIVYRGKAEEAVASAWCLGPLLLLVGWTAREASTVGIPIWSTLLGLLYLVGYTYLCGRDFSFVGAWGISLSLSSLMIAFFLKGGVLSPEGAWALGINAAWLTFTIYDLAALMSRRRRGEEPAAVVDLFRDVFNIFGYIPRVISHWRRHKIWERL